MASLCGYSEYTSASSPPKKYLSRTISGDLSWCYWNTGTCGSPSTGGFKIAYSGSCVYNPTDCSLDASGNQNIFAFDRSCSPNGDESSGGVCKITGDPGSPGPELTETLTRTSRTLTGNGVCDTSGPRTATGTAQENISDEDTDESAIARLLAGPGGVWGDYSGGTSTTCRAAYQSRTTTFDFEYTEAQFKVTGTGLTPSTTYRTFVDLYRRPYGAGSFTLFATMEIGATSDSSGNIEVGPFDVDNAKGFETYAAVGACPP